MSYGKYKSKLNEFCISNMLSEPIWNCTKHEEVEIFWESRCSVRIPRSRINFEPTNEITKRALMDSELSGENPNYGLCSMIIFSSSARQSKKKDSEGLAAYQLWTKFSNGLLLSQYGTLHEQIKQNFYNSSKFKKLVKELDYQLRDEKVKQSSDFIKQIRTSKLRFSPSPSSPNDGWIPLQFLATQMSSILCEYFTPLFDQTTEHRNELFAIFVRLLKLLSAEDMPDWYKPSASGGVFGVANTMKTWESWKEPYVYYIRRKDYTYSFLKDLPTFDEAQAESFRIKGNEFYNDKKMDEAIDWYTQSLRHNEYNFHTFLNRSLCYLKLERFDKALEDVNSAIQLKPTYPKSVAIKAKILLALGSTLHAESSCVQAITYARRQNNTAICKEYEDLLDIILLVSYQIFLFWKKSQSLLSLGILLNNLPKLRILQDIIKKGFSSLEKKAMCKECVTDPYPDRESMCCDDGTYFLNYKHCKNCQKKTLIKNVDRKEDEESDGEETVVYQHSCSGCGHVIAEHYYRYELNNEEKLHNYLMECLLCGRGKNEQHVDIKYPDYISSQLTKEQLKDPSVSNADSAKTIPLDLSSLSKTIQLVNDKLDEKEDEKQTSSHNNEWDD
ncbi:hypothetical protein RFI_08166 [Reticulomyxa filosa]|uniref:Protein Churchill n=1 Tax=Reticulomyxa filosa TaxID=46433 RepID=X6NT94_RETFI|nr:hypothetical protein RFI_08166 [Reticulomyxa filosa]|eukprot:ETO28959.1 hypothetical protein RFI_08166 [Reticulomyxa filosa]